MRHVLALTCLLLFPASSHAQEVDSFIYLPAVLNSGERVTVTGAVCLADTSTDICLAPPAPATIRGKVDRLTPDVLVIAESRNRYVFRPDTVDRIERPKERVWNGALIGYGIGFALGYAWEYADCQRHRGDFIDLCYAGVGAMLITGPIGFGIGALADAGISRPRLVFTRPTVPAVRATREFSRRGAGIAVSVGF